MLKSIDAEFGKIFVLKLRIRDFAIQLPYDSEIIMVSGLYIDKQCSDANSDIQWRRLI